MFIDMKQIDRHPGSEFKRSGVCDFSAVLVEEIAPLPRPVKVEATVSGRAGLLYLTLSAEYDLVYLCDRCNAEVVRHEHQVFRHLIQDGYLDSTAAGDEDVVQPNPDGKLPIDDLLWEDIMLAIPTHKLCREDCRGLCFSCGSDLNQGDCKCGQNKQVKMDE